MAKLLRRIGGLVAATALTAAMSGTLVENAGAASLPSAVTGPPSGVTVTGVTLSGDVNPNGVATTWFFEYGTSTRYGLTTDGESAGAGAAEIGESARLAGLTPGTTYDYRLVARSSAGASYGDNASFHTPAVPPTVTSTSVVIVHDTAAAIVAGIDPNGLSTTWYVAYGTTPGFGSSSPVRFAGSGVGPVAQAVTLSHLAPHTTYYLEAVGTNAAGTHSGPVRTLLTSGAPIVTAESVAALTPTSVTLTGSVIADGHPTTCYFQWGPTTSYGISTVVRGVGASMGTVNVARSLGDLTANATYHFRLVAVSVDGTVAGNDATFTTPGPTLASSTGSVTFGGATTLSGSIPSGAANQRVDLYEDAMGSPSFVAVATLLTGTNGIWSYSVQPRIATSYKVVWGNEVSPTLTLGVSPSVKLRERSLSAFITHVSAGVSLAGRVVRLQRYENGNWRSVSVRRLNQDSSATFRPRLPSGASQLRVYLTAFQAGAGYLAALSGIHRVNMP